MAFTLAWLWYYWALLDDYIEAITEYATCTAGNLHCSREETFNFAFSFLAIFAMAFIIPLAFFLFLGTTSWVIKVWSDILHGNFSQATSASISG
mmetsp:Transcript_51147/g.128327  ORF Transcript_51147/g.128327 Transcript_51147/m.128327 type:complete len:94 (-) Transcript_51147:73-354(-)